MNVVNVCILLVGLVLIKYLHKHQSVYAFSTDRTDIHV